MAFYAHNIKMWDDVSVLTIYRNLNGKVTHLQVGVEMSNLIDDLLTDGIFQRIVLIAPLFNRQIRPLSKPRVRGERHDRDGTAA
jgi:hypothetical protein